MLTLATWNVNSVKPRLIQLLEWLRRDSPSIVLLQEIKCVDEAFPSMEVEELGYNVALHGQKTYNGVAILSKYPLSDIRRGLPDAGEDIQSRYIEALAALPGGALRVASVYVPNGQTPDSDKFQYKLAFLGRLRAYMAQVLTYDEMFAIGGDYNIAPADLDVHEPRAWAGTVLTHEEARRQWRALTHLGLHDAYRQLYPANPGYSWWDYRAGAFARDDGLRIDHVLLNAQAADRLAGGAVEKDMRAVEKASDHTPVIVTLDI